MTNEEFYEREIAPVLLVLAQKCDERGVGMLASVEYEPDEFGSTFNRAIQSSEAGIRIKRAILNPGAVTAVAITISEKPDHSHEVPA